MFPDPNASIVVFSLLGLVQLVWGCSNIQMVTRIIARIRELQSLQDSLNVHLQPRTSKSTPVPISLYFASVGWYVVALAAILFGLFGQVCLTRLTARTTTAVSSLQNQISVVRSTTEQLLATRSDAHVTNTMQDAKLEQLAAQLAAIQAAMPPIPRDPDGTIRR